MKVLMSMLFGFLMVLPQSNELNKAAGNWEGNITAPGVSLKIVFHIVNSEGKLSATMDSPDQDTYGLKMDEVVFANNKIKMTIQQYGGQYEGELKDDKFVGKWSQGGQSIDLNLTRIKKKGSS
ncbi:hypothetical protein [Roseivirga sp. UBA838]|uniref:hypothetical protein n=1 Tax=Roseivirga sp. UBA838 TaxID=1947393 RepID=UPI00257F5910|nr:hypothetical protein [Roseivirga sp. UBA838]|tara:strand:+ start:38544 stop:38912 length:369 start_codon:yes stop_codon:yes gene_type:complete